MEVFKLPQALHSFVNCNFCPHPSWQVVNTPSSCASHSSGWWLYKHSLLKKWCFISKLCLRPVCISWCRQSQLALFTLQACQSGASSSLQQRDFILQSCTWIICSPETLKMLCLRSFFICGLSSKQMGDEKQYFSSCISSASTWCEAQEDN